MGLLRTANPATAALLVDDVKSFLRVDEDAELAIISSLIGAATKRCEELAELSLITQTWRLTLDDWPCGWEFRLPRPPLQSVTSITYVDLNGATQTLDPSLYDVDTSTWPGVVVPSYLAIWPAVRCQRNAVTVTYVSGFGDGPNALPGDISEALKVWVAHRFENRANYDQEFLDSLFARFHSGVLV